MLDNFPTKMFIHWPKNIYPCGLIMYSTTLVHKKTQTRKCSTTITPGIPP